MIRLSRALSPLLALTLAAVLANCSTSQKGTGGEIVKASYYKLDAAKRVYAADPAIPFEQKHYLHGAVTREEQAAREGHYYTFFWQADDRSQPVNARLQYRQKGTGSAVHEKSIEVAQLRRTNKTKFDVIGDEFATNGKVTAWKFTLEQGGNEIASTKSYLWD